MLLTIVAGAFSFLLSPAVASMETTVACPALATHAPLPAFWGAWSAKAESIDAGVSVIAMPGLFIGKRLTLKLAAMADMSFLIAPSRPAQAGLFGGVASLDIDHPERIGFALSSAGWITVITRGAIQQSVAHERGIACSGIAKIVWFDLAAGSHIVQIENAPDARTSVMVVAEKMADVQ